MADKTSIYGCDSQEGASEAIAQALRSIAKSGKTGEEESSTGSAVSDSKDIADKAKP